MALHRGVRRGDHAAATTEWDRAILETMSVFWRFYATSRNNPEQTMDRLDAVTVFVAVAEQESFAAAARKLSRTPAAVTRAVAELEDSLSTRLLNRTTRSVALTEAGQLYLERARKLLAAHAEFEGAAAGDREPSGLLHVTAPANFGRQHLMPLLSTFLEKYPRVDARVLLLDRVVSMVEEGLDVGVRLGKLPDSSLRATRAGTVKMAVY